jgi:hypothetical protein
MSAPFLGFAGIPFAPQSDNGRVWAWEPNPVQARRKVAGASVVKRQFLHFDADRLELTALVEPDAYAALLAAIGTAGTLTLTPELVVAPPASRYRMLAGAVYVAYPATTLVDATKSRRLRDGRSLCTLTFERDHETGVA